VNRQPSHPAMNRAPTRSPSFPFFSPRVLLFLGILLAITVVYLFVASPSSSEQNTDTRDIQKQRQNKDHPNDVPAVQEKPEDLYEEDPVDEDGEGTRVMDQEEQEEEPETEEGEDQDYDEYDTEEEEGTNHQN